MSMVIGSALKPRCWTRRPAALELEQQRGLCLDERQSGGWPAIPIPGGMAGSSVAVSRALPFPFVMKEIIITFLKTCKVRG